MFEYEEDIEEYAQALRNFIEKYELPEIWFGISDHLALKCADGEEYDYVLQELLPDTTQISEVSLDGRRLAALYLTADQAVGTVGKVRWIEVMEPRPEKIGKDLTGIEHMEFYYPDFSEIGQILASKGIDFSEQSNPGHAWINIVINNQRQELKLNNKLLADMVHDELQTGVAHLL